MPKGIDILSGLNLRHSMMKQIRFWIGKAQSRICKRVTLSAEARDLLSREGNPARQKIS